MAAEEEIELAPGLARNADHIDVQLQVEGTRWETPRGRLVVPKDGEDYMRPYIALNVAGVRLAFFSAADARAVVLELAAAVDAYEELHQETWGE